MSDLTLQHGGCFKGPALEKRGRAGLICFAIISETIYAIAGRLSRFWSYLSAPTMDTTSDWDQGEDQWDGQHRDGPAQEIERARLAL